MNKTIEAMINTQEKQMSDSIASKITAENHKKYTELLLKNQVEKAIRGEKMPRE